MIATCTGPHRVLTLGPVTVVPLLVEVDPLDEVEELVPLRNGVATTLLMAGPDVDV